VNSGAVLVFDLDGTLSDPVQGIGRSINHALTSNGFPSIGESSFSKFIGPPIDSIFEAIIGSAADELIRPLVASYRDRYTDIGYAENVLYDGVVESLDVLKQAGERLGVCTSKRADIAGKVLRHFGLSGYFDFVSGGDIGVNKAQQLAGLLSQAMIGPGSIMIGDRAIDIHAARANGLLSVGVLWGHGSREELSGATPGELLESPAQLRNLRAATYQVAAKAT